MENNATQNGTATEKVKSLDLKTFAREAREIMVKAEKLADKNRHEVVDPIHIFACLFEMDVVKEILERLGIDLLVCEAAIKSSLTLLPKTQNEHAYWPGRLLSLFSKIEKRKDGNPIQIEDLLSLVSAEVNGAANTLLKTFSLNKGAFDPFNEFLQGKREQASRVGKYTKDLSLLAKTDTDPLVGREKELKRLIQILGRHSKNHPILVGEYGVGKTTIVMALAKAINSGNVPPNLKHVSILQLEMNELFAGVKARGEVDERIKQVVALLKNDVILFIDGIEAVVNQGAAIGNLSDCLKPILMNGKTRFFASSTPGSYKKVQEKDTNLLKHFTVLNIEEPSLDFATEIVKALYPRYEIFHSLRIDEAAAGTAVKLAKRYVQDKFLPESALSLIDEAGSKCRIRSAELVEDNDVASVLSDWTGIPASKMMEAENEKLSKMEGTLGKRVVGQNEAIGAVSRSVRRSRVGLREGTRPIGSFLFLGSSGVGKTEVAKALAEFLFDDEKALTRFDMSEFQERHMAQRLIGAPPGYADSEAGGHLTEAVKKRPYSVLLFDEVEKAHPDVFNLLLQVLDDGRLTDGRGKTADFSNTVVIMTSNIGTPLILDVAKERPETFASAEGVAELKETLLGEVKKHLRPEFINRIDDIVVFQPLTKENLTGIVDIQLRNLEKVLENRKTKVNLTPEAKQMLVDISYEPRFGARPLKRSIMKNIQDPISELIVAGRFENGRTVLVDVVDGKLVLT
jgi:ATP-dependent Clp protease ATP-binding subunit ClpC